MVRKIMRKVTHFGAFSCLSFLTITLLRGELVILLRVYRKERADTPVKLPVLITCFSGVVRRRLPGQTGIITGSKGLRQLRPPGSFYRVRSRQEI
jgi:hypothetical protein